MRGKLYSPLGEGDQPRFPNLMQVRWSRILGSREVRRGYGALASASALRMDGMITASAGGIGSRNSCPDSNSIAYPGLSCNGGINVMGKPDPRYRRTSRCVITL